MTTSAVEGSTGVARIEAFSDGVFAIAITLLVLDIHVPPPEAFGSGGVWGALAAQWPSYAAYVLSFAVIGIMWANHHNIFRYIGRANHLFVMVNIALMFCVALLPFPTAALARYLPRPEARTAATVLYGATLTCTALVYNLLWHYAARGRRLLRAEADQRLVRAVTREYAVGPICYALATLVALVNVWASLGIHAVLAALYVVPNRARP